MLKAETVRKLTLMSRIGQLTVDQIIDDAVELYYDVYEVDRVDHEKEIRMDEETAFTDFIFRCNGTLQAKGRLRMILAKHGIRTKDNFLNAPMGEIMNFDGVGKQMKKIVHEMIIRATAKIGRELRC